MNMWPGLCVIMNGGREASATACGVTPQAQNTGTSPGLNACASPQSGLAMSLTPIAAGSPMCTGAPGAVGPEVGARGHADRLGRSDVGDLDQRARPRVALAEEQEIVRVVLRQHREIGLHEVLPESGRDAVELATPDVGPDLARVSRVDRHGSFYYQLRSQCTTECIAECAATRAAGSAPEANDVMRRSSAPRS